MLYLLVNYKCLFLSVFLLIKREKGDFIGLYGLPRGKVEECEHIDIAIERQINEELGLKLKFNKLLGTATEIMP